MAIGYTELDFVNGQAPALSAANLNHIDEGVKACADQLDAETAPGRALVEAATVAAQRTALDVDSKAEVTAKAQDPANVQAALTSDASGARTALGLGTSAVCDLGVTGVESATKVPKALGADLVALITAAGYTLNPATGSASLDGIADGTTYKRVLAAIATALNAGTYDAYSVSRAGIGSATNFISTASYDLDTLITSGLHHVQDPVHAPTDEGWWFVLVLSSSTSAPGDCVQVAWKMGEGANPRLYLRQTYYSGAWLWPASWTTIWTSASDGNGGQPPAAKSNKTSDATIGWFDAIDVASGASATLPSGGQFEWWIPTYGATYNGVKSGISAGGALSGTASANLTIYYKRLSA